MVKLVTVVVGHWQCGIFKEEIIFYGILERLVFQHIPFLVSNFESSNLKFVNDEIGSNDQKCTTLMGLLLVISIVLWSQVT